MGIKSGKEAMPAKLITTTTADANKMFPLKSGG